MLPCAHGGPLLSGSLRASPEDFVVEEQLGYQASGDGEHAFLTLRKRDRNTHEVAHMLARFAGVAPVAVGYAGLKDRNAVTTQHFTVQLPGREVPDWSQLEDDSLQILEAARHHRKIRRGGLRGNRFVIRVAEVRGDRDAADRLLRRIAAEGVPNYFGSQRFGHAGQNLQRADELFAGQGRKANREQRGLLLSAARSQLFNLVLQARVAAATWNQLLDGDVVSLAGSQRQFMHDPHDATIAARLAQLDLHPTGPLCGRPSRALQATGAAQSVEQSALSGWQDWIDGLSRQGVDAERRALRLVVDDLAWQWQDDGLVLSFALVAGSYATVVLREIVSEPR
jgi:tRNA pseudouridine13 synthase